MGKSLEGAKGSVWAMLLTAHAVLVELIEARLAQQGLPPLGWYDVLWALERAEEQRLRMNQLAENVVLSRSNLTRLVDRLEQAGLVGRQRSKDDRRGAFAVLTAEGKAMRKRMWPVYKGRIDACFGEHVTLDEARSLADTLEKVQRHLRGRTLEQP